jgi:Holliday junction resolvasome RuvABC ATP-dependent DNA helicase subunit
MEGYLHRTPQGRTATELGYQRLGLKMDGGRQQSLL